MMRAFICFALAFLLAPSVHAGSYTQHEVMVGDQKREYRFYRPSNVPKDKPAKAVIAFHGFMSDPNGLRWLIKADKPADKHGFAIIYPQAIKGSFNAGRGSGTRKSNVDEAAFIKALMKTVVQRHNLDAKRIYTMGFSNGAQMSALMLCNFTDQIAGAALVAHSLNIDNCKPKRGVSTVLIQGAKDPFVPFGGGGKHKITSHKDTVTQLRSFVGAGDNGKVIVDKPTIRCRSYDEKVRSCVGFNDGHTWPGGVSFKPEQFGKTNTELNGTDFILGFFAKQTEPVMQAATPAPAAVSAVRVIVTRDEADIRDFYEMRRGVYPVSE